MVYALYDRDNKQIDLGNLQHRAVWYEHGVDRELVFISRYGKQLGVGINPEKTSNASAPDLMFEGNLADLKCQDTPFFFAGKLGVEPTYAVTFNLKDALNYGPWGRDYPGFHIFYWVDWVAVKMRRNSIDYTVEPLTGIWRIAYSKLEEARHTSPIHWYSQRNRFAETDPAQQRLLQAFEPRLKEGTTVWSIRGLGSNAASSYVFDLRNFERVQ